MKVSRNKRLVGDHALNALFRAFEEGTTLSEHGLSYQRLDFEELYEVLPDAFEVKPAISRSEAIALFGRALRECRHAGRLTADGVALKASELHRALIAVPLRRFTLWTKFRARGMPQVPGFRLDWHGVSIRAVSTLPPWLSLNEYLLNGVGPIYPSQPHGYGYVVLSCEDRSEDRAVDRMMDALQLILGLANIYETWGRWSHWGGQNWTEGGLWLGPSQFVFDRRAFRGEERIWYNPDYDEDAWNRNPPQMTRVLQIIPMVRRSLATLSQHPLREILVRATMSIQDGFATRDSSHRLLRYWSALEHLYVEKDAKGSSNEKILERALFAEIDPVLSRWKLEHIARLRNEHVHSGGINGDLHSLCQFLRHLLGRHINYWTFNGSDIADHTALLAFTKLSSNRDVLTKLRDLVDRRIAFVDTSPRS